MQIALLGLPQSGKRTLLELLTGRSLPARRKPGEPITGRSAIRDPRVGRLSELFRPRKTIYAENSYLLPPDLGDAGDAAWYDLARRCDLLCPVVRAFSAEQVYHPRGSVDPQRDREAIEMEMVIRDLERAMNRLLRIEKEKTRGQSAVQKLEEQALRECVTVLDAGQPARTASLAEEQLAVLQNLGLLTLTPTLWIYNAGEDLLAQSFAADGITVSAQIEKEILEIDSAAERDEYLAALGLTASGCDRLNLAAYAALEQMSFYTVGPDEVRAWTIRRGTRAPVAGGKIHSDIERGFIRVEVIKYDDLLRAGSEKAAKEQGQAQLRGKDYAMEDGDVCHFLFNV